MGGGIFIFKLKIMKHLKKFNTTTEYDQFKSGSEFVLPNVSFVENSDVVYFNPFTEAKETRIVCTYNVTSTTSNTGLCQNPSRFISMEVDGILLDSITTGYKFDTEGEHTVKFELADSTSIGNAAFAGCRNLTSVSIPDSITSIGQQAFAACEGLTSITIPNSVTSIGEGAFTGCYSLTSVIIPDSVTSIERAAFSSCSGLTSVTIGSGVKTIGDAAFVGCTNLNKITCRAVTPPTIVPDGYTFKEVKQNGILKVPVGSDYSYWMKTYDYYLGYYNWTIEYFYLHEVQETRVVCTYNVTDITNSTQLYNQPTNQPTTFALMEVDGILLDSATNYTFNTIGNHIVEFVLDDPTTINNGTFNRCTSLTSITIPDSVTTIGDGAFQNCTSLTSIMIPDSVTYIGGGAFSNCTSLTSVTIGNSITSIIPGAFSGCTNLNEITCLATTAPSIQNGTFANVKENGILKVPTGSDYSSWMITDPVYLGYYKWTVEYI